MNIDCMNYAVISFYKYSAIDDPEGLKRSLHELCREHTILGRILIAHEGINGAISGRKSAIEAFKQKLRNDTRFSDITFREQEVAQRAYHKLVVRVRDEVVVFGTAVNMNKKGTALAPKELKEWYDRNEDFVILDARNDYEYKVGKFKNAIALNINNFRELPFAITKIEQLKNKKVVMYCTGGIRCEKASAFLRENGFKEVYQLEGGIINYVTQFPQTYFKGSCFVFDDRKVASLGEPISVCEHCGEPSDEIINCYNLGCDKLFVSCTACQQKMNRTCSMECKNAPQQRKLLTIQREVIGIVENYYARPKVAHVRVINQVTTGSKVVFAGKTTQEFEQKVAELRNEDGQTLAEVNVGERITLPVLQKVRRNDKMLLCE